MAGYIVKFLHCSKQLVTSNPGHRTQEANFNEVFAPNTLHCSIKEGTPGSLFTDIPKILAEEFNVFPLTSQQ